MSNLEHQHHHAWNKGKLVGQKAPLRLRDIWAIRVRLQLQHKDRDLALFNLAIDSKLRACDLVPRIERSMAGLGFVEVDRNELPESWKRGYDMSRPSRAFAKRLRG